MPRIIFVAPDGMRHDTKAEIGSSAMQTAVDNGIPGIDGDCGGQCACATCHVYVHEGWTTRVGPASPAESQLLDFTETREESSRLSCQIKIDESLDGLILHLPQAQH